jgi:predicted nuclease with TOPRIM domain
LYHEPARKAYSFYGSDPEIRFKERRLSIRIYMPTLSAYEVQKRIEDLNDELTGLKEEIEECQKAIQQLRTGKDPENARREFRIIWSLNVGSRDIIDRFKDEIASRKQIAGWIRRERAIYLWELRLRKVEGLKLPLTKHKIGALQTEAKEIVVDLKGHMEQVNQLLERYRQVSCETGELEGKVRKLDLENQPSTVLLPRVPSYMQETTQKQLKALNEACVGLK